MIPMTPLCGTNRIPQLPTPLCPLDIELCRYVTYFNIQFSNGCLEALKTCHEVGLKEAQTYLKLLIIHNRSKRSTSRHKLLVDVCLVLFWLCY